MAQWVGLGGFRQLWVLPPGEASETVDDEVSPN